MSKETTDWEKVKRINSKVDFVRAVLDAILDAAKETPGANLYFQVRHAVQHIEGYPGGFEEQIPDDARKRLIKIVEKFYQLYGAKNESSRR